MGLEMLQGDVNEFKCQTGSVFCAAAIAIVSFVGEGPEELVYYIAESTMDLNSIESSLFGKHEGCLELLLECFNVL